jgi:hypothetical protein
MVDIFFYSLEDIINDLRSILFATLASSDPSEGRKHDEAIRLLITIGPGTERNLMVYSLLI